MAVVQKETDRHTKAFEKYFECRCVSEVARFIGVSRQSIDKWRAGFLWDDRVILREKKVAERLENKVVNGIVDKKAKMLQVLDNLDIMVDQEIITAFIEDEDGNTVPKIHVEKLKDFIDLMKLKISVNDNRLKVLGEDINIGGEIKTILEVRYEEFIKAHD